MREWPPSPRWWKRSPVRRFLDEHALELGVAPRGLAALLEQDIRRATEKVIAQAPADAEEIRGVIRAAGDTAQALL